MHMGKVLQKKACRSLSGPSVREEMFARTDARFLNDVSSGGWLLAR